MTMAFDYKKEYKEFYLPPKTPGIITVPAMNFLAVRGKGNPNEEGGAYKQALGMLYAVAFTIKMSKLGKHKLEGYFDYVVPPLEGLWWQEGRQGVDYARKDAFGCVPVDLSHPPAGVRDGGGLCLGRPGGRGEEAAGLLPGGVFPLGGGAVRPVHAHRPL